MNRSAFVYLLRCADGTLYTGWTFDVTQRVHAHQTGRGARYTRTRRPVRLVYSEQLPSRREAMRREIALKHWSRARKLALAKTAKLPRAPRKKMKSKIKNQKISGRTA
jgi:putative endonuclease